MQIALLTADISRSIGVPALESASLIAGQTILQHQLDVVLGAGCDRVICLVERQPFEIEALRQRCARAGVPLRLLHRPQELSALVAAADRLLVIGANVLIDAEYVPHDLDKAPSVLALPAEQAVALGFERIDAKRAWAGVMLLPGTLIEKLHQLPGDIDAASALLRIALMSGVPTKELPARLLTEGSLIRPRSAAELQAVESERISRLAKPVGFAAPLRAVVERLTIRTAPRVLASSYSVTGISVLIACILLLSMLAAQAHSITLALAGTALAYGAIIGLRIIRRVAGRIKRHSRGYSLEAGMEGASDLVLLFVLASANAAGLDAGVSWFAPIVFLGLLRLAQSHLSGPAALVASDRVLLTVLLLFAQLTGVLEAAVMLLASATLALLFAYETRATDITTT